MVHKNKVIKHLKGDIKTFKKEAEEDKKLISSFAKASADSKSTSKKKKSSPKRKVSKGKKKIAKVMREFKAGELHSGSKKGPKVTNPKQAIAIGLSEARKAGAKISKKKQQRKK